MNGDAYSWLTINFIKSRAFFPLHLFLNRICHHLIQVWTVMDENRKVYFVKSDKKMFALLLSHESWNITGKPRSLDLARKQKEAREGGSQQLGRPKTYCNNEDGQCRTRKSSQQPGRPEGVRRQLDLNHPGSLLHLHHEPWLGDCLQPCTSSLCDCVNFLWQWILPLSQPKIQRRLWL